VIAVGVAGYIAVAVYGLYPLAGFLLLLLAYGLSVGALVAVFQVIYGAIHYFHRSKGNKYYLGHCKGGASSLVDRIGKRLRANYMTHNQQIKYAHFVRPTLASSRGLFGRYVQTIRGIVFCQK